MRSRPGLPLLLEMTECWERSLSRSRSACTFWMRMVALVLLAGRGCDLPLRAAPLSDGDFLAGRLRGLLDLAEVAFRPVLALSSALARRAKALTNCSFRIELQPETPRLRAIAARSFRFCDLRRAVFITPDNLRTHHWRTIGRAQRRFGKTSVNPETNRLCRFVCRPVRKPMTGRGCEPKTN